MRWHCLLLIAFVLFALVAQPAGAQVASRAEAEQGASTRALQSLAPAASGVNTERTGLTGSDDSPEIRQADLALPADKILEILRAQPALVLEIKKILIRKAYDRGRILYAADLTDEALFQLVSSDVHIRAICTREIESRGYLNLRPTKREMDQLEAEKLRNEVERERRLKEAAGAPAAAAPAPAPAAPAPQRSLQRAASDNFDDTARQRIGPEDLPGLLSTEDRTGSGEGSGSSVLQAGARNEAGNAASGGRLNLNSPWRSDDFSEFSPAPVTRTPAPAPTATPAASAITHRPNPYADVPSLYDLYAQVAKRTAPLQRFGMDIFQNGTGNFGDLPMDLPVGPDYVLGPGDGLRIDLWGSVSQRLQRIVDREGRVALPEAGLVLAAGRTLGDMQREIQATLRTQFRDVHADVSLARLRTVRVYVVGDVQKPGPYDISSLSTPLNAVFTAGGPTAQGSIRTLRQYRGKQLVQEVDVYDLILHGVRSDLRELQPGDTILVPPLGPQVTIDGMVRRPAIYELRGEQNLAEALEMSGGVLSTGTLRHIDVERVQAHQKRVMLSLDLPESNDRQAVAKALESFKVQDGDSIRIAPILPYSDTTVFLDGHVFHPGKYPYHDGMKLTELIHSYKDLLPEPSRQHAEIIRLNPPDYQPAVLAFNLGDALDGKGEAPVLKAFDTVRIFGRYDFQDAPEITVTGEVRDPGRHLTNGETHLSDAIYLAGGTTPDALLSDVQVYRTIGSGEMSVISADLAKALGGDAANNVLLEPRDRIIVHRNMAKIDPPTVTIRGEVAEPGKYPLGEGMTVAQLVRLSGGFKRSAYTASADLFRYMIQNGRKVVSEHIDVPIGAALSGVPDADFRLRDGDVVTVGALSGWSDIGASITISGEVEHPGTYAVADGEKLSSVLKRAGGFRPGAYTYGAVLERSQVRELAEKSRQELIRRIESSQGAVGGAGAGISGPDLAVAQAAMAQQHQVLASLKAQPAGGRMVVRITPDISRWEGTAADVEVRGGDTLFIPKRPNFVVVTGQANSNAAITYSPGKNASWYLQQAGGATSLADRKGIFVIRADGSVIGSGGHGFWKGSVLSSRLEPGDTLVVPSKIIGGSMFWKNLLNTAQITSSLAIAARVATSF